jgi:phosphate transport system protein
MNAMELRIEEECLKILSLYAPTAKDLRFVVAVFKITNDLERVGDLAVNIAERVLRADAGEPRSEDEVLQEMAVKVRAMLNASLDAFLSQDEDRAHEVLKMDDTVDDLLTKAYQHQVEVVSADGNLFRPALRELSTAKHLERIADHATNIAEDVVYMVSGEVVKHQH